jgi:uncharacterized protein
MNLKTSVTWFEIPVGDLDRARVFYGELFGVTFEEFGTNYFIIKGLDGAIGGAIFKRSGGIPTGEGPSLYFSSEDCGDSLQRALSLGATHIRSKTVISGGMGAFCSFRDTEGNEISLWSKS